MVSLEENQLNRNCGGWGFVAGHLLSGICVVSFIRFPGSTFLFASHSHDILSTLGSQSFGVLHAESLKVHEVIH